MNDLDEPAEQEKKKTGDEWMKVDEQDGEAVEGEELEESEETRRVAAATEPSKQMREEHEAQNHAVYRSWCQICVESRGLGTQHRKKKQKEAIEDKEGPKTFSDYYFMSTDEQSMPMLALKFSRSKRLAATAIPSKGLTALATKFSRVLL